MKKVYLGIGVLLIAFVSGFYAFNWYIYNQKQAGSTKVIEPYRGTLTGEYICLKNVDQHSPQTFECALGIKTDTNEYYALDFDMMSQQQAALKTGDRFTASGLITPIEYLSSDHWQKYNVEGIFSVTDSVKKL